MEDQTLHNQALKMGLNRQIANAANETRLWRLNMKTIMLEIEEPFIHLPYNTKASYTWGYNNQWRPKDQ